MRLAARPMGRSTENARSAARSTGKQSLRLLLLFPRAHARAPEQGGRDGPRLAACSLAAWLLRFPRREGARADAPTNKGRRKTDGLFHLRSIARSIAARCLAVGRFRHMVNWYPHWPHMYACFILPASFRCPLRVAVLHLHTGHIVRYFNFSP